MKSYETKTRPTITAEREVFLYVYQINPRYFTDHAEHVTKLFYGQSRATLAELCKG